MVKKFGMLCLLGGMIAATAGCTTTEKTITGAAVGGVSGAVAGSAIAGSGGAIVGGIGGAVAGGIIGREI